MAVTASVTRTESAGFLDTVHALVGSSDLFAM